MYVTNKYKSERFDTPQEAADYIKQILKSVGLKYEPIFVSLKNDVLILIYQYSTLYFETFIVHKSLNLQKGA